MSIDEWLSLIEKNITQLGMINSLNTKKATDLLELKEIFTRMQWEFWGLTNYKKIIKLFEARRMLSDANLCSL
jgi:hypothetical protein